MLFRFLTPSSRRGFFAKCVHLWVAAFLAVGPMAYADVYYVATTGSDSDPGSQAQPFRTITHALSVAQSGDIINVAAGTYGPAASPSPGESFPLSLKDGVQLIGAGAATTTIDAVSNFSVFANGDETLSSTTLLSGFTVTASSGSFSLMYFFPYSGAMAPQIQNNIFQGNAGNSGVGIFIGNQADATGSFTGTISNNTFTGFSGDFYLGYGYVYYTGVGVVAFPPDPSPSATPGAVNLSPTIAGNTFTNNSSGVSVAEYFYYYGPQKAAGQAQGVVALDTFGTMAPVITGNTFQDNEIDQLFFYLGAFIQNFSPQILNNVSSGAIGSTVFFPPFFFGAGETKMSSTWANPFQGALKKGASARGKERLSRMPARLRNRLEALRDTSRSADKRGSVRALATNNTFGPQISGNTSTLAPDFAAGGVFMFQFLGPSESTVVNASITDNTYTGGGIQATLFIAPEDPLTEAPDTITISGNTVTDALALSTPFSYPAAVSLLAISDYFPFFPFPPAGSQASQKQAAAVANSVLISENVIQGNIGAGLVVGSQDYTTVPFRVECNTITGNSGDGFVQLSASPDPNADLGGGAAGSIGNNNIYGNAVPTPTPTGSPTPTPTPYELRNEDPDPMFAQFNYWGLTTAPAIDARIGDDEELIGGAVDFSSFRTTLAPCAAAIPDADLQITKAAPPSVDVGSQFDYTLTIRNNGPGFAPGITVLDPLPAGATFVSGTPNCSLQPGNTVRCQPGSLSSGQQGTVTIRVTAPVTVTTLSNTATIESSQINDTNLANNSSTAQTNVTAAAGADVSLTKTASPSTVAPGGPVVYTLTATNNGPATATNVVISDPLPAGSTFVSASAGCTFASGTVTCAIGTLTNGQSAVRTVTINAPLSAGQFSNVAVVTANESDPSSSNNSGAVTTAAAELAAVPTLSEWAMLMLAFLLMGSALFVIGRRNPFA